MTANELPASGLESFAPLSEAFFSRPTLTVASDLIGKLLVHGVDPQTRLVGRIVETEAYHEDEPACHAWSEVRRRSGKAPINWRGGALFGRPGLAYIYFNYGMYWLLNVITEPEGVGAAVLIRAVEPLAGIEFMRLRRGVKHDRELTSGPGKLTVAFDIDDRYHLLPLTRPPLFLADTRGLPPLTVGQSKRIGITKAAELPWRFYAKGNHWVSNSPRIKSV